MKNDKLKLEHFTKFVYDSQTVHYVLKTDSFKLEIRLDGSEVYDEYRDYCFDNDIEYDEDNIELTTVTSVNLFAYDYNAEDWALVSYEDKSDTIEEALESASQMIDDYCQLLKSDMDVFIENKIKQSKEKE